MKKLAVLLLTSLTCIWSAVSLATLHRSPRLDNLVLAGLDDAVEAQDASASYPLVEESPGSAAAAERSALQTVALSPNGSGGVAPMISWPIVATVIAVGAVSGMLILGQATTPQGSRTLLQLPLAANLSALQQHLYDFKVDRRNRNPHALLKDSLTFQEMIQRARELGLSLTQATAVALFSDFAIGARTRDCLASEEINKGVHPPVHTKIFDEDGSFDEKALKNLFKRYAGGRKFITRSELQKMSEERYAEIAHHYQPWQAAYWSSKLARFGSNGEWDALLKIHRYKVGDELAIRYQDLRNFFVDASLLYQVRAARQT